MFKRAVTTAVAASVIWGTCVFVNPAQAAIGTDLQIIPVIVNGQKVKFPDTEPYINSDGRTMVPVRFVSEKLGAEVNWDTPSQTATVEYSGKKISMAIGSNTVRVNGQAVELDTQAEMYEGRTMVPLRFVSEVLGSKVDWDNDAHSVRVTDAQYQAKVDAGKISLDPWGREYSKDWSPNWMKLTDLESTKFYSFYGKYNILSRDFFNKITTSTDGRVVPEWYKEYADAWSSKIRKWYEAQLNVDYRTIDEDALVEAFMASAHGGITMNAYFKDEYTEVIKKYVQWVKENKIIAKGYADPELSTAYQGDALFVIVPTRFKFMIISANDTAQTFMDNWDASKTSDSFPLEKGVWYDGYGEVFLDTNVANDKWSEDHGLRSFENMFSFSSYFYDINE